jgi:hypothetical protein
MWELLANLIGGPIVTGLIKAYQAKLAAGNTSERIAADLAARARVLVVCDLHREMRRVGQGARPRIDGPFDRRSRHMGRLAHGALVRRSQRREGRADHRAALTAGQGCDG